jgi:hypothetical protein
MGATHKRNLRSGHSIWQRRERISIISEVSTSLPRTDRRCQTSGFPSETEQVRVRVSRYRLPHGIRSLAERVHSATLCGYLIR